MSVVNEDFLDCAMVSSGVTVVVASVQEHSARVVRHLPHPNSMSLPIVSPHLLLHKLLTSPDHGVMLSKSVTLFGDIGILNTGPGR